MTNEQRLFTYALIASVAVILWFYGTSVFKRNLTAVPLREKSVVVGLLSVTDETQTSHCDADTLKCDDLVVPVAIIFTKAAENPSLQTKFRTCIQSMLANHLDSKRISLRILGDKASQKVADSIFADLPENDQKKAGKIIFDDIDSLLENVKHTLGEELLSFFRYSKTAYFGDYLFFISIVMFKLFPTLDKVIMLDSDLMFRSDIAELWNIFDSFTADNVIGIAHEAQPVYRHVFSSYRSKHRDTKIGEPPPDGITGFNSGVLLMDLQKMRSSSAYTELLNADEIERLANKYSFKGHLGDQDFYTLLSTEHSNLFYILPCNWNRQLCRWWETNGGYQNVFHQYFDCHGPVHIYHGNCNTKIPDN